MTGSPNSTVLFIGLKGSGKTTFLAALWHLLEAQEILTALRTPVLQPDREYLNGIRRRWLEFQPMERTGLQQLHKVSVNVEDRESGRLGSLIFPDISGEVFRMQWEDREAIADYFELERSSPGAVLFVHPHGVRRSRRIGWIGDDLGDHDLEISYSPARAHEHDERSDHPVGQDKNTEDAEWHPRFAPTQVQLVDLIQNYLQFNEVRPLRLSMVVSAWDLVKDLNPETWFETRLPLLAQFLYSRRNEIEGHFFGVSAQGGDLDSQKANLARLAKASERPIVVEEGKRHSDLTAVVKWALPK
jgi:hypothetical protein